MKVEGFLFGFLALFFAGVSTVYWLLSRDPSGGVPLALLAVMAFMVGYYLLFTSRRMEARPEDRPDAEIADGAGEIGFFSPHSWWPIVLALSFVSIAAGAVFGVFLLVMALGLLAIAVLGFTFEYYLGINRTQGQTLSALEAMGEQPTSPHKFLGE